jgi:DNA polymerase-4
VTVLAGVGARTAEPLHRLGVRTVRDLAEVPLDTLRRALGAGTADHLHELSRGRDPRPVAAREPEKSISADHTTDVDLLASADVHRELLRLADEVGRRVRERALVARTVGIKIRFADFRTVTRVRTLPSWVDTTTAIYEAAAELYRSLELDRARIRLVGVKCENLRRRDDAPRQMTLTEPSDSTPRDRVASSLDRVRDAARVRFGATAVGPATLVTRAESAVDTSP